MNPLLLPSTLPFGAPPFHRIEDEHFVPAIERSLALAEAEIAAIAHDPDPPNFQNTIVTLERSGQDRDRILRIFGALAATRTNEALQAIQREVAPKLSAHRDAIFLDRHLFERIEALHENRAALELDAESLRLLERYHTDFVRAGATLGEDGKERLREINTRLAELGTLFQQHLLAEMNASAVVVEDRGDLAGLPETLVHAAAAAATERDLEGKYVLTLQNTTGQPALAHLRSRDLRERLHRASIARGSQGNEYDTTAILSETLRLRSERAQMLGFDTHADFILAEQTARRVEKVNTMLKEAALAAVANARREGEEIQRRIDGSEEEPFELAPWDWAYYAEQVRQDRHAFDAGEVRPYFELEAVLEKGVFHAAQALFGITFQSRPDLPVYHPDVQVWEVFEENGSPLGLMYGDFYARSSKRGGAWMSSYSLQSHLLGGQPVTGNHLNLTRPPEGEPMLLTWDEVTTLFHEFGHVLHGLLSRVTYPRFSGTSVPRDFVEYPSQLFEMWASWPEVLRNYAVHHRTGEPIPGELLERAMAAEQLHEGFRSTEYLAAAILDQALHQAPDDAIPSAAELLEVEARILMEAGLDYAPVPPRYRLPYFSHVMGGYSAGYYSYFWSEVLDADSEEWFRENGGLTRENGERYRECILAPGGSRDPMEMYRDFAGRDPDPGHLLRRRGLMGTQGARAPSMR
ncbi:MAG: M3 family peptidase [Gemmatimonadales bacterium]|nr:MAG: M3 family peptidase [Gemmatimonadales bacterium]